MNSRVSETRRRSDETCPFSSEENHARVCTRLAYAESLLRDRSAYRLILSPGTC
jgi:hypothetical protein